MQQTLQGLGTALNPSSLLLSSCSVLCWQRLLPTYQRGHFRNTLLTVSKGQEGKLTSPPHHTVCGTTLARYSMKCPFTWESLVSRTHMRHCRLIWLRQGYCPDGLSWTHSFFPLRDVTRLALKGLRTCLGIFLGSQQPGQSYSLYLPCCTALRTMFIPTSGLLGSVT